MAHCLTSSSSSNAKAKLRSQKIERQLNANKQKRDREARILLIGMPGSGKSTLLKQLRVIHGRAYSEEERAEYKRLIDWEVFSAIQSLIQAMEVLGIPYRDPTTKAKAEIVKAAPYSNKLKEPYALYIADLWEDPGIQECYQRRREYRLPDSTKYFMDKVKRLAEPNYLPSKADIVQLRIPTAGVAELKFEDYNTVFRIIKVGGVHGNSRKWIHHFEKVDRVVFVASLSEYDEVTVGQSSKFRTKLEESIELFRTICNYPCLTKTPIVIFLNKKDLLAEKILYSHLADYFPDFDGGHPCNEWEARDFILKMFVDQNPDPEKSIDYYSTCATDTENTRFVFSCLRDTILGRHVYGYSLV